MQIKPIIAVTMGDPAGIGPEIIHSVFSDHSIYDSCRPLVLGDLKILEHVKKYTNSDLSFNEISQPDEGLYNRGSIDIINITGSDIVKPGEPTKLSGKAMIDYIEFAIDLTKNNKVSAMVTCPINKAAMQLAQSEFHGHTELLANRTKTDKYAMMLTGETLKVVLVTIHIPLKEVVEMLTTEKILETITITNDSLIERFGIEKPSIAVAGLNPHAGEEGLFGDEEEKIIEPAVTAAKNKGIDVNGPYPPDTVYYNASKGEFDAVISMYHDQGLIPFKMIHFSDGVNTTLGLPIIRTSVDHGTAYDITGRGIADHRSLKEAIIMASTQATNSNKIL